jgi:hypothetical protein
MSIVPLRADGPDEVKQAAHDAADAMVVSYMRSGSLDKTVRVLQIHNPNAPWAVVDHAVSDAVVEAYEKLVGGGEIDAFDGYVYATAEKIVARSMVRHAIPNPPPDEWDEDAERIKHLALKEVLAMVDAWPASNVRAVTKVLVEAASEGIHLLNRDVDAHLRSLGMEMSQSAVDVWKKRGFAKLVKELEERGISTYASLLEATMADLMDDTEEDPSDDKENEDD